jgi:hypothetical protein
MEKIKGRDKRDTWGIDGGGYRMRNRSGKRKEERDR